MLRACSLVRPCLSRAAFASVIIERAGVLVASFASSARGGGSTSRGSRGGSRGGGNSRGGGGFRGRGAGRGAGGGGRGGGRGGFGVGGGDASAARGRGGAVAAGRSGGVVSSRAESAAAAFPPARETASQKYSRAADGDAPPLSNDALVSAYASLRVIASDGANLGVFPSTDALALARSRGHDLVLVSSSAATPVARLASLVALADAARAKEKAAVVSARAAARNREKEIRLTSRTSAHDLETKTRKLVGFLKQGLSVTVRVSFSSGSAWTREEPARRAVLRAVAKDVAADGSGFCDAGSITGRGNKLDGTFTPTKAPRAASDWAPTFARLDSPIRPEVKADVAVVDDDGAGALDAEGGGSVGGAATSFGAEALVPPTLASAAALTKSAVAARSALNVDTLLPPAQVLLDKFGKRKPGRAAMAARAAEEEIRMSGVGGGGGAVAGDDDFETDATPIMSGGGRKKRAR